jgi:RNA recognition motif-containing protein
MAKLYVGNLPFETTEDDLKTFFGEVAQLSRVTVVRDKFTNRSRGFAFVEIDDEAGAKKAIETLNGRSLGGRSIKVNEAKPQEPRQFGGGGGGGGGGPRPPRRF